MDVQQPGDAFDAALEHVGARAYAGMIERQLGHVAAGDGLSPAVELWSALDTAPSALTSGLNWRARLMAYRYATAAPTADSSARGDLLAAWRWSLPVWTEPDRAAWFQATATAADNQRKKHPEITDPKN